ncbi:hypothetical protein FQA39_LY13658 [Lamprigera yunnana]|nr:hypothetical protein FQA39_LY13658 [Lamprigera yunnana]
MNTIDLNKTCRTCVKEQPQLLSINTVITCNGIDIKIMNILNSFVTNEIRVEDGYPEFICLSCLDLATKAYNFKLQCDQSYTDLERIIKNLAVKEKGANVENRQLNNTEIDTVIKEEFQSEVWPNNDNVQRTKEFPTNNIQQVEELNAKQTSNFHVITNRASVFYCPECDKRFKNKHTFNAHQKRHKFRGQFLCNICGKGFSSSSCLARHNKVHTGEKNYECKECCKRFPSAYNLSLHSRTHSGVKPFSCTMCEKKFNHPSALTYHVMTHTNKKPYRCEICNKDFALQCHFIIHQRIHSGERPFTCLQCGKSFMKKGNLQSHIRGHSGIKPYSCNICRKRFYNHNGLKLHMTVHTKEHP